MKRLSDKEEQVMQILWKLKKAFVKEILESLEDPKPPVTTVSSIIRKLEGEGWVGHETFGKTYRYYPKILQKDYLKSTLRNMASNYFEGSPERLLSYFLKEEEVDLKELNAIIEQMKKDAN